MRLEYANIVCPKCGNGNYMRYLVGKGVKTLDMKCINCNSYFSFDELYKKEIAKVLKPKTNGDRIRSMSDEELAERFVEWVDCGECPVGYANCTNHWMECKETALKWLKAPVKDGES